MANQKLALADNDMLIQAEKNERNTAEAELIKELESLRLEKVGFIMNSICSCISHFCNFQSKMPLTRKRQSYSNQSKINLPQKLSFLRR